MLVNAHTAISTSAILLVPYCEHHVPKYHEWMQDEEIQEATASEPLSLDEEYTMQASWRQDADKLTFIACLPLQPSTQHTQNTTEDDDGPERMVGDVNLFLRPDDEGRDDSSPPSEGIEVVGEIELMIAEKHSQRRGYGRGALLAFLRYICEHEETILDEFLRSRGEEKSLMEAKRSQCLSVKIGQTNTRSLALFESLGFAKVSEEPNYFGEFELRRHDLTEANVRELEERFEVRDYVERRYRDGS